MRRQIFLKMPEALRIGGFGRAGWPLSNMRTDPMNGLSFPPCILVTRIRGKLVLNSLPSILSSEYALAYIFLKLSEVLRIGGFGRAGLSLTCVLTIRLFWGFSFPHCILVTQIRGNSVQYQFSIVHYRIEYTCAECSIYPFQEKVSSTLWILCFGQDIWTYILWVCSL